MPTFVIAQTTRLTEHVRTLSQADGGLPSVVGVAIPGGDICARPLVLPSIGIEGTDDSQTADTITGFTQMLRTAEGTAVPSGLTLMPMYPDQHNSNRTSSSYYPDTQESQPGYYRVVLNRWKINVELTATAGVAMYRFTYPRGSNNALLNIDSRGEIPNALGHCQMVQTDLFTLQGFRTDSSSVGAKKTYFAIQFDRPIHYWMTESEDSPVGKATFEVRPSEAVQAKVSFSNISAVDAQQTMNKEIPAWDFDQVCTLANEAWNEELAKTALKLKSQPATKQNKRRRRAL